MFKLFVAFYFASMLASARDKEPPTISEQQKAAFRKASEDATDAQTYLQLFINLLQKKQALLSAAEALGAACGADYTPKTMQTDIVCAPKPKNEEKKK